MQEKVCTPPQKPRFCTSDFDVSHSAVPETPALHQIPFDQGEIHAPRAHRIRALNTFSGKRSALKPL